MNPPPTATRQKGRLRRSVECHLHRSTSIGRLNVTFKPTVNGPGGALLCCCVASLFVQPAELDRLRQALDRFVEEVFSSLARKDRVATAGAYLRGLMLDGRRKSMQPMARRLGVDHQRLQQFVTTSPWDVIPVRQVLARRACELLSPQAWVVDDTGSIKYGDASPGVSRQYSETFGEVRNCQVAVSIHAVTDAASAPLDWRLFLPENWDDRLTDDAEAAEAIAAQRRRSAIPDDRRYQYKWKLALEMIGELTSWGRRPPVIVAGVSYSASNGFRDVLTSRRMAYLVAVEGGAIVCPVYLQSGKGLTPNFFEGSATTCRDLVLVTGAEALTTMTWQQETGPGAPCLAAVMHSRFVALRVRVLEVAAPQIDPANAVPRGTHRTSWTSEWSPARLLAEWPSGAAEPTAFWLTTLPESTPLAELVRLAKLRWRVERDYQEMKAALGLDHYEGRSFRGWHHHVTLVSAAHLFLTTLRSAAQEEGRRR